MGQILILWVLASIFFNREINRDFDGIGWTSLFILLPALLPALVVGVISGICVSPTRMKWAVLARIGATVLVMVVGASIAFLGGLASFDLYGDPIALGEFLGILLGMEAALALSWVTAMLVGRINRTIQLRSQ